MPEDPSAKDSAPEGEDAKSLRGIRLTDTQRQILEALCRPRAEGNRYATAATNQEIAGTVYLSVDAVKAHLRVLYRKFGVEPLPHNQKRARLVELAIEGGLIEMGDGATAEGAAESEAVGPPSDADADLVRTPPPPPVEPLPSDAAAPVARAPATERDGSFPTRLAALGAALLAGLVAVLLLTGVIGGSDEDPDPGDTPATSLADYKTAVGDKCTLSLRDLGDSPPGSTGVDRAFAYFQVFAGLSNLLEGTPQPAVEATEVAEFIRGVESATDSSRIVAETPRMAGQVVGDLVFASGQAERGTIEAGLGPDCREVANLIDAAAKNAAVIRPQAP